MTEIPSGTLEDLEAVRRYIKGAFRRARPGWFADRIEDATQGLMVRLLGLLKHSEESDGFTRAYLSRAVYHYLIDEIRAGRHKMISLDDRSDGGPEIVSQQPDPERKCQGAELYRAISDCVAGLNTNRRHAVGLWLVGHEIREIEVLMNWTPRQAENHVTRGRRDLRTCLEKKGFRKA